MRRLVNVRWRKFLLSLILFFGMILLRPLQAFADPQDVQTALQEITDTANSICVSVGTTGSSTSASISANVSASLGKLLGKLATVNGQIGANAESAKSSGILQQDLLQAIHESNDCKLDVFDKLEEKLIPN